MSGHKNFNRLRDELRVKPVYREMLQQEYDSSTRRFLEAIVLLTKLREVRGATQQQIADAWGSTQANVSQIEHTPDIYLSTLRGYVEALGGRFDISAIFPDETINLTPLKESPHVEDEPQVPEALRR